MGDHRNTTRRVLVGGVPLGGGAPIAVQSMCNTDTRDIAATLFQIDALKTAGCEITRLAIPDEAAAQACDTLCRQSQLPLVADIHFDYRLALRCVQAGVAAIRINPGNIGAPERVKAVADACKAAGIPIRIGINGGSLERELLARFGGPTAEAMVQSALSHIALLEQQQFFDIVVSLKASDVRTTIEAYRLMANERAYPLHLGVTEAGTSRMGLIKSAVGIGSLLCDGIGDTIRVSLTADPVEEVAAAYDILSACGLRSRGIQWICCPTCGRCRIDLISLANQVQRDLSDITVPLTVAVMGCGVNGPGEARQADVGIAGGVGEGMLFVKGQVVRKVPMEDLARTLEQTVRAMAAEREEGVHGEG